MSMTELDQLFRAPEYQVRAILIALCDDHDTKLSALKHYRAIKAADQPAQALKRKAMNDLFICVQCQTPFSQEDNKEGSCYHHPGDMDPDYDGDFWADHDENIHGVIDSSFCRQEYPDGFKWTCCEQTGDAKGCTPGKHEAHPDRNKRGRADSYPRDVPRGDIRGDLEEEDEDEEDEEDEDEEEESAEEGEGEGEEWYQ